MTMRAIFYSLLLVVVFAPLPFGSNIPAAWNLWGSIVASLALLWAGISVSNRTHASRSLSPWIVGFFLIAALWAALQALPITPAAWGHPIWAMAAESLHRDLPPIISVAPDKTQAALIRLLTYALVFLLCFQLCRDRERAKALVRAIATAGALIALYGLIIHWGDYATIFLYEKRAYQGDLTSTFINRNSYATYAGLSLLCAMGLYFERILQPRGMVACGLSKANRIEILLVNSWLPLLGLVLITTALISSHSRGGFISACIGLLTLLGAVAYKGGLRTRTLLGAVVATIIVTFFAYTVSSGPLLERFDRAHANAEARVAVYEDTWRAIQINPWLGYGYGAFEEAYPLYRDRNIETYFHKAHNTYLENLFGLGIPGGGALFASIIGATIAIFLGIIRRRRDWIYPAVGFSSTILVGVHALVDFSLEIPAVAITYAAIVGLATAQSLPSRQRA